MNINFLGFHSGPVEWGDIAERDIIPLSTFYGTDILILSVTRPTISQEHFIRRSSSFQEVAEGVLDLMHFNDRIWFPKKNISAHCKFSQDLYVTEKTSSSTRIFECTHYIFPTLIRVILSISRETNSFVYYFYRKACRK